MTMIRFLEVVNGLKPVAAMVVFQTILAGANIFYKLAEFDGMSMRVLIAYRFLFAAILIDILALVIERRKRPKLTWLVVGQSFVCGLLTCAMPQNLFAEALTMTSSTFVTAMFNLVPGITFILAVAFGLERLGLRTVAGIAKAVGTMTCISGAMVLTFYKGPELDIWHKTFDLLHKDRQHGHLLQHENISLGSVLVICSCFSFAMGLIVQAKMLKNYPCTYSSTALITTIGAIQAIIFALCMERKDWSQWKLGWNVRLLAAAYHGFVTSGGAFLIAAWCIKIKGPLYVSVFSPLMLVVVAVAASLVLGEKLHMGSVIGAIVIICGLYLVLWGKGKELQKLTQLVVPSQSFRESKSDNTSHHSNSMGGVLSNEFAFVSRESIDGDHFCERNEIGEEGNDGKPNIVV